MRKNSFIFLTSVLIILAKLNNAVSTLDLLKGNLIINKIIHFLKYKNNHFKYSYRLSRAIIHTSICI